MHLKSLKVFCDVVGRRSFSRAADENGITQSAASQMVHHLEEHLGVRLLDRSKRPFVLTPEGKVYHQGCRRLVQRFATLEEEVRTFHQEVAGRVSIASIYSVGLTHLNELVDRFTRRHPKAKVAVEYHHPHRVYELVEQDRVDFGLVSYPKSNRSIKGVPWRREPVWLVCSPGNSIAAQGALSGTDLNGLEIIGFDADLKVRQELDRALASSSISVNVVMEFDNIETIKRAVEIYQKASFLPEPTVRKELQTGELLAIPVTNLELWRPVGLIKRRGVELGKTARRFMQLVNRLGEPDEQGVHGSDSNEWEEKGSAGRPTATEIEPAAAAP